MQLADVFGGDIDFYRDLRKGDASRWSTSFITSAPAGARRAAMAAEFVNQGRTVRAVHFGSAITRPTAATCARLSCARRSSSRGELRLRHAPSSDSQRLAGAQGIDYAAPIGTRVRAWATASWNTPASRMATATS